MMRFTLVCVRCVRGWESDIAGGTCDRCGGEVQVRGGYYEVNLRPPYDQDDPYG